METNTITIPIPDELDAEAGADAKRLGTSKSELIRRGLTVLLPDRNVVADGDPWRQMAGFASEDGQLNRVRSTGSSTSGEIRRYQCGLVGILGERDVFHAVAFGAGRLTPSESPSGGPAHL